MTEPTSTRESIFNLIENNPGIHFREIQRKSGLAVGQVEYHLYQLEKEQKIVTREDGKVKRYFCIRNSSYSERQLIFYLRSSNSREVLQKLAHNEMLPLQALTRVRKSKIEKRKIAIERMVKDGILEYVDIRGVENLRIKDLSTVLEVARRYRESFLDTLSDNFISMLDEDGES